MKENAIAVAPMARVIVMLSTSPVHDTDSSTGHRVAFIYGIGSQGITPFEKALHGKTIGDHVTLEIVPGQWGEIFGHLGCQFSGEYPMAKSGLLTVTVVDIGRADTREVVKALAQASGCGGGCDCGCGC